MSFSPYVNNGGTALAVSGDDFAIVSSDTRISTGYAIHTRSFPKVIKLYPFDRWLPRCSSHRLVFV